MRKYEVDGWSFTQTYYSEDPGENAEEYQINPRTLRHRLALAGIKLPRGSVLAPDQVRIYKALGAPPFIWEHNHLVPFISDDDY